MKKNLGQPTLPLYTLLRVYNITTKCWQIFFANFWQFHFCQLISTTWTFFPNPKNFWVLLYLEPSYKMPSCNVWKTITQTKFGNLFELFFFMLEFLPWFSKFSATYKSLALIFSFFIYYKWKWVKFNRLLNTGEQKKFGYGNQTSNKTCEIEIGQKVFSFRGNAVAQPKNPAIVRTLLLLHNRHFERRHTSHSGTNLQKSAKN